MFQPLPKIALIGHGFVGAAVNYALKRVEKLVIDPRFTGMDVKNKLCMFTATGAYESYVTYSGNCTEPTFTATVSFGEMKDLREFDPEIVIISVPTPMNENGYMDGSFFWPVIKQLAKIYDGRGGPTVVVKCTMTPDMLEEADTIYPGIVYFPEFLTEANSLSDSINPTLTVLGGSSRQHLVHVETLFREVYSGFGKNQEHGQTPVRVTDFHTAAMVKLTVNSFLALKVGVFNELYRLFETRVKYDEFRDIIGLEPRMGKSHTQVPGPDGKFGFGGKCLSKDPDALCMYARTNGSVLSIIERAIESNLKIRGSKT